MGAFLRPEFLILVVIALLIFGPKKLPEMGSSIGKTIREFQKSMREVKEPEQPSATVPPATSAPAAQIAAPATNAAATVTAEAPVNPTSIATPAPAPTAPSATTPSATTPTADPLPPVGTTVE